MEAVGKGMTRKEFFAMPDDQPYLCYDQEVASKHNLGIPFPCGSRKWEGGGYVRINFYSKDENGPLKPGLYQVSEIVELGTLRPSSDSPWIFHN